MTDACLTGAASDPPRPMPKREAGKRAAEIVSALRRRIRELCDISDRGDLAPISRIELIQIFGVAYIAMFRGTVPAGDCGVQLLRDIEEYQHAGHLPHYVVQAAARGIAEDALSEDQKRSVCRLYAALVASPSVVPSYGPDSSGSVVDLLVLYSKKQ